MNDDTRVRVGRTWACVLASALADGLVRAQPFPPGYVDPQPLLAAAALEIGEAVERVRQRHGRGRTLTA